MNRNLWPQGELSEEWRAGRALRVVVWSVAVALLGVALLLLSRGGGPVVLPAPDAPLVGSSAELELLVREDAPTRQDDRDRLTVESSIAAYAD